MDSSEHVSASKDEKQTRIELINPVLFERGWGENLIREEKTPVARTSLMGSRGNEGGVPTISSVYQSEKESLLCLWRFLRQRQKINCLPWGSSKAKII